VITWDSREGLSIYIDEVVGGAAIKNAAIAQHVNEMVHGARLAGALVGRWRRGEVEISPGNLAALARAYGRNPLEAFVIAGLLRQEEAEAGLDLDSLVLLAKVRSEMTDVFAAPDAEALTARARKLGGELSDPPATQSGYEAVAAEQPLEEPGENSI
jgi:hypothetical protein